MPLVAGAVSLALGIVVFVVGAWGDEDGGASWGRMAPRVPAPKVFWHGNVLFNPGASTLPRRMPGWRGLHMGWATMKPGVTLSVYGAWPNAAAEPVAVSFVLRRLSIGVRVTPEGAIVFGAHGWWLVGIGGALLALPIGAPLAVRRWRRGKGLCAACGYPATGPVCPECGAASP